MQTLAPLKAALVGALVLFASTVTAGATSFPVAFNYLLQSATVQTPLEDGDSLLLNTLITTETGALLQEITFTLGSSATTLDGYAVWQISESTGNAPRLIGVDINIFDSGNNLVLSDTFGGVLGGFAVASLDGLLSPGTYTMVVSGTAIRDTVLDVSLTFSPEPGTALLLSLGLGGLAYATRRHRPPAAA